MSSQNTPVRIAMWSGPRNISTALMRAWENRPDTAVCDEPFYAYYLNRTGLIHPGRNEIIESQATEWPTVMERLTGRVPEGKAIFYQKHMVHHLLPEVDRSWLPRLKHALCRALKVPFLESMLSWPPGSRVSDGVWAPYWYDRVESSSGFRPYRPSTKRLPSALEGVCGECLGLYARLHGNRLEPHVTEI